LWWQEVTRGVREVILALCTKYQSFQLVCKNHRRGFLFSIRVSVFVCLFWQGVSSILRSCGSGAISTNTKDVCAQATIVLDTSAVLRSSHQSDLRGIVWSSVSSEVDLLLTLSRSSSPRVCVSGNTHHAASPTRVCALAITAARTAGLSVLPMANIYISK
jgi:hypothetical protein